MDGEPQAGSLHLVAGDPALDFANTVSWRSTARELDHLQAPEHVLDWAMHAALLDTAGRKRARAALTRDPEGGRQLLRDAIQLRDAIWEAGSAIAAGGQVGDGPLAIILRTAAEALPAARLVRKGAVGYELDFSDAAVRADLLGRIAWSMLDLLRSDRLLTLKQCPAHDCGGCSWTRRATALADGVTWLHVEIGPRPSDSGALADERQSPLMASGTSEAPSVSKRDIVDGR